MSDPTSGLGFPAEDFPDAGALDEAPSESVAEQPTGPTAAVAARPPIEGGQGWLPATPRAAPRSRRRLVGIGAVVVALAAVAGKSVLGLVAATVVGGALGTFLGGPFERLPADQRQHLESRFDAAVGDRVKGLSDSETQTQVLTWMSGGLPRLDDATLIEWERQMAAALQATDTATCAAFARQSIKTTVIQDEVTTKMFESLDPTSVGRRFEIEVQAIAAETRGTPPARSVTQAARDAMFAAVLATYSAADQATMQALSSGSPVADPDACEAFRNLYLTGLQLDPTECATFALADVTP